MTTTVTDKEAGERLRETLDLVEQGETVEITREGRTVAKLEPILAPEQKPKRDPEAIKRAIDEWIAYRDSRNITLGDVTIRDLIDEGRKY